MRIRFYIILGVIMFSIISGLRAQNINNYAFTASSGTYVELVNPTVPPLSGGDFDEGNFVGIPVGFEFWYMGNLVTFVHASTNGLLSLNSVSTPIANNAAPNNSFLINPSGFYRPYLAPLWDNLDMDTASGAEFSYATLGAAPNRVFVAQWKNAEWNWFANDATISFQVKLYETSGTIEYVYQQESGSLFSPSATIGIAGQTSGAFLSLSNSSSSPSISNSTSYNLINSKPSTGQTYTFTPPIPSTPFSLTFSNINPTNVTLNWGSASINLKYAIFKSTDNINFTYAGYSSTANYVVSGLSPNTLYYFNVYAVSEGALSVAPASGSVTTQSGAISGTITVPGNAPTITSILDSIKAYGIGGPVFIELANGYNSSLERYPIYISDTLGTSASAPLTIRPALGASDINFESNISGSAFGFYFSKAKYITFDGRPGGIGNTSEFTIRSRNYPGIYFFSNGGSISNILITYLKMKSTVGYSSLQSYIEFDAYNSAVLSDIEISQNEIGDSNATATYGISIYNYNTQMTKSVVIKNNRIFNMSGYGTSYGIQCYGNSTQNVYLIGNHIYNTLPVTPISSYSNYIGISVNGGPFIISNNFIGGSDTACLGAPLEVSPASATNYFLGIYANVSTGKTVSIQGNKIANFFWPSTSQTPWTGVWVEGGGNAYIGDTMSNVIGDSSSSSPSVLVLSQISTNTPIVYGIRYTGTGTARIKNNVISGINGVGTNSTYPCSLVGILSSNSYNVDISSNLIGSRLYANSFRAASPSANYAQSAIGILVSALGSGTINIKDNTICNLVNSGLSNSLSNFACGIHLTSSGTSTVTGNNLSKIYSASGSPTNNGVSAGVGIYYNTSSGLATIARNIIHTLRSTNTTAPTILHGININSSSGSNILVDANFIHSFSSATSSISGALVGINIQDGVISATNNMIRLGIDNNGASVTNSIGMIGINKITGYTTYIYNNSVYIGGSASNNSLVNTYAFRKVNDGSDEVKNNVFINARTNTTTGGKHYAMALNSINNFSSNNNLFFAPGTGGRLFLNGSTEYTTRGAWFLATNLDDNSDSSSVPFINATGDAASVDLHLAINTPTKAEGNATTTITTTDFDGQLRSSLTPNDIGADADNFIKIGITPAPVIWMWVKANKTIYDCHVKWMVALENNNNFFTVERSFDGKSYQEIGKVKGAGNRNVRTLYEFNDKGVYAEYREVVYYRIVQYDFDGRFSYSQTVAVYTNPVEFESVTIYPNPARDEVKIALPQLGYAKTISVNIVSPDGKKYLEKKLPFSTELKFNTDNLPQGVYFVTIKIDEQSELVKKLTIQ